MISKQNGEIRDDVNHKYIDNEYKNFIENVFKFKLMDEDLTLTNFDNQQLGLTNVFNTNLEKNIAVDDILFNFKKSIKKLANIDNKYWS